MTEALETRLVGLRNRVALLYGEDLAQEMVIRMILSPELNDQQVLTKAKWLFLDNLRKEPWCVQVDQDEMDALWNFDDTDRIHARIELQHLYNKSKRIVKIIRVELGLLALSSSRRSVIRAINRNEERESL
ncbi:hypothetical protein LCGC14_0474150 [marine sediment metagenome]|uniref:Uncharacterized protein n=1 Tax=marine sediment metagenome TaxID=412755 RepID=A0A0F9SB57_9ZZZZ